MNALYLTDGYKLSHHQMYPEGTTMIYSNLTPRSTKYAPFHTKNVVVFGVQMALLKLTEMFNENFFNKNSKEEALVEIRNSFSTYFGDRYDISHFEKLYNLGYLPIEVRSLPEGSLCPIGFPVLTVRNTHPDFAWLTNYLETILLALLWKPISVATVAKNYKDMLEFYANETDNENVSAVDYQAHDFSMRGLSGIDSIGECGAAFLTSFKGSDSLPAINTIEKYYSYTNFPCNSVKATEHSVATSNILYIAKRDNVDTREAEKRFMIDFINKNPKGIVSYVADSFDYWEVISGILPEIKDLILARDGKFVLRPDSGDIVETTIESVVRLWDIFGGSLNSQGYKVLNPKIGLIYGDGMTAERVSDICQGLRNKGFASTNVVLGIGAYSLSGQLTRDSFGQAFKCTAVEIYGEIIPIYKKPKTDGSKSSAKGLLKIVKENDKLVLKQDVLMEELDHSDNEMRLVYRDGKMRIVENFDTIKNRLNETTLAEHK